MTLAQTLLKIPTFSWVVPSSPAWSHFNGVSTTLMARLGTVERADVLLYTSWASHAKMPACSCICNANREGSVPKGTTKAKQKSSVSFGRKTSGLVLVCISVVVVVKVGMVELLVVVVVVVVAPVLVGLVLGVRISVAVL